MNTLDATVPPPRLPRASAISSSIGATIASRLGRRCARRPRATSSLPMRCCDAPGVPRPRSHSQRFRIAQHATS
uniref:Uncharacterized protein n=1 Tax=Arundo donax TaxID=35708 RepID=A0A0A9HWC9_ARUDO